MLVLSQVDFSTYRSMYSNAYTAEQWKLLTTTKKWYESVWDPSPGEHLFYRVYLRVSYGISSNCLLFLSIVRTTVRASQSRVEGGPSSSRRPSQYTAHFIPCSFANIHRSCPYTWKVPSPPMLCVYITVLSVLMHLCKIPIHQGIIHTHWRGRRERSPFLRDNLSSAHHSLP